MRTPLSNTHGSESVVAPVDNAAKTDRTERPVGHQLVPAPHFVLRDHARIHRRSRAARNRVEAPDVGYRFIPQNHALNSQSCFPVSVDEKSANTVNPLEKCPRTRRWGCWAAKRYRGPRTRFPRFVK